MKHIQNEAFIETKDEKNYLFCMKEFKTNLPKRYLFWSYKYFIREILNKNGKKIFVFNLLKTPGTKERSEILVEERFQGPSSNLSSHMLLYARPVNGNKNYDEAELAFGESDKMKLMKEKFCKNLRFQLKELEVRYQECRHTYQWVVNTYCGNGI